MFIRSLTAASAVAVMATTSIAVAQTVTAPYAATYSISNLGTVPGVPGPYEIGRAHV